MFTSMIDRLHDRDRVFFDTLAAHKNVIVSLQQQHESSLNSVTDKLFTLNGTISNFMRNMEVQAFQRQASAA